MLENEKKVVVITGASSGRGLTTAKHFRDKGFVVYNLSRRGVKEEGIFSISCDIRCFYSQLILIWTKFYFF